MKQRTIKSLSELIAALRKDLKDHKEPVWYRGHGKVGWQLTPALHRLKNAPAEIAMINQFRQNANLLVEQTPQSDFDWLFLMQHYGVPTRLLDWFVRWQH